MFGTACTPETPIGTCMVSSEGACAAYYNFGRFSREPGEGGDRACDRKDLGAAIPTRADWAEQAVADGGGRGAPHAGAEHLTREEQVLERIARARARKARIREERITLSHGAGGKATQTLIEAVFLEAFRNPVLEQLEDGASLQHPGRAAGLHHRLATWSRRCSSRAATSATWRSTAR